MISIDTLEGVIKEDLWYHYDVGADVLYLCRQPERETETFGEEADDGFILHRAEGSDRVVAITVVSWWKRFGTGALPDSIAEIHRRIEPWASKLAA